MRELPPDSFALCADGFTMLWLFHAVETRGKELPSVHLYIRKYFIEPIEDEL